MPSLAELQSAMARALLADDAAGRALPAPWFAGDASRGLKVHRNNVLGACVHALELSYPTVQRLAGAAEFDQLAAGFVRAHPPSAPMLSVYGEAFADWIGPRLAPAHRALLQAVARFDWLFERVAQLPADGFEAGGVALDGGARLQLATSLRLHVAPGAIDLVRAGELAPEAALAGGERHLALWRRAAGVAVRPLRPPAARMLAALRAGAAFAAALEAAAGGDSDAAGLALILEQDVLRAGYARIAAPH